MNERMWDFQYFSKWPIVGLVGCEFSESQRTLYTHTHTHTHTHTKKYQSASYVVGATFVLWNFSFSYINVCVLSFCAKNSFSYSGVVIKKYGSHWPVSLAPYLYNHWNQIFFLITLFPGWYTPIVFSNWYEKAFPESPNINHVEDLLVCFKLAAKEDPLLYYLWPVITKTLDASLSLPVCQQVCAWITSFVSCFLTEQQVFHASWDAPSC